MDSPSPQSPDGDYHQRPVSLYQYHNAPEVAPAHGLEYDDHVYPHSDKFPVIREAPSYDVSNYKGKHAYVSDNRPPRIIFGMKVKTFLIVSLVMGLIIVGAAVGGAVGGKHMRKNQAVGTVGQAISSNNTTDSASQTLSTPSITSTFSAPTPTYTPLSDCPDSNNTTYTSPYTGGALGTGFTFTKFCNAANPLSHKGATRLAQAFVYTFSDCVDVCAGLNYDAGSSDSTNCSVAVYMPADKRPYNCAVGHMTDTTTDSLGSSRGTNIALLST